MDYYVYFIRQGGFADINGIYSSDLAHAKKYSYADAITLCKLHIDHEGNPGAFPISIKVMEQVLDQR